MADPGDARQQAAEHFPGPEESLERLLVRVQEERDEGFRQAELAQKYAAEADALGLRVQEAERVLREVEERTDDHDLYVLAQAWLGTSGGDVQEQDTSRS